MLERFFPCRVTSLLLSALFVDHRCSERRHTRLLIEAFIVSGRVHVVQDGRVTDFVMADVSALQ